MSTRVSVALSMAILLASCSAEAPRSGPEEGSRPIPGTPEHEWYKFDHPGAHIEDHDSGDSPGPGATPWESVYESLTRTDTEARSQGFPSHAEALAAVRADASQSNLLTQLHKNYILFVKHRSEGRRPEEASLALKELFGSLVERQFRGEWDTTRDRGLPFEDAAGLQIRRDVVYGADDPEYQTMDVYLVPSERPTPVMIEFHGGGWRRGNRRQLHTYKGNLVEAMFEAGISLVAVDYRLSPRYRFPAQMQDAVRAVQFVRSRAKEWNIDPRRVAAMGGSAGGHLTAWVALNEDQADPASEDPVARQSSRLTCFFTRWAPIDLTRVKPLQLRHWGTRGMDYADAFCGVFGLQYEDFDRPEEQERIRAASPLFAVTPDDPPGFLMYGGAPEDFALDDPPPVPEAIHDAHSYLYGILLHQALSRAGVEHVPHIGPQVSVDHEGDVAAILAFLERYLEP